MTNLIIKLFVRDADRLEDKRVRQRYGSVTSIVGIIVNFLLFAGKFLIGTLSGSVAGSVSATAVRLGSGGAGEVVNFTSALFGMLFGASSGIGSGSRNATPL